MRAVNHAAVLNHLDHVQFVAPVDHEGHVHLLAGLDARAHRRALHRKVHLDAISGQRISTPRADRFQDAGAAEVRDHSPHQSLAVGPRKPGMVVGGSHEAETQPRRERRARGIGGLAPAHGVREIAEGAAVLFRVAVLREDLHHRRAVLAEHIPVHAAPALGIGKVVRNHQRVFLDAEAAQLLRVVRVEQGAVVLREHHALISPLGRVPFEAEKRAELVVPVALGDHLLHPRPGVLQALEAVDPVPLALPLHRGHVVPAGMPGEGEEIQMRARDLQRALDRAHPVAVRVVVVDVAVQHAVAHSMPSSL
jgi:hypothetical protein